MSRPGMIGPIKAARALWRRLRASTTLNRQLRVLLVGVVLPFVIMITFVLSMLGAFNQQYAVTLQNVSVASDFNFDFKDKLDLDMYYFVVGSGNIDHLPIEEVTYAQQIISRLNETTVQKENKWRIKSMLRLCTRLSECMVEIQMSRREMEEFADKYIDLLQIKTASRETPIKSLSGGNQQKVIIARWLLTNPDFLILDEPTRGIDIGTKTEIQKLVLRLADQGMSVAFISSEIEEMLRTCSRMVVMRDGRKVGELSGDDLTQERIMKTIAGGEKAHA